MAITEVSILHHIGIVLVLLWILSSFGLCHPFVFFVSFIYLYQVNEHYTVKLRRRLHFEERKQARQKRLLSDSETVRWLNHAVEKIWPICMEQIASQKILLPIIPWFLDKYKPWSATKAVVQHLYLGRNPPMFTEIRVLHQSVDDDHLVLELGMNFLTADDMNAILAVKLRKSLGFGIWAKMHITGMHIEGKALVGVKFLRHWPFLGRLRVCFVEPPYFQMTVKPIFSHGLDVTELPGIAGWLDKILAVAFEQTLVEPNMLVVDVEKFASTPTESWFTINEKRPIAFAKVEVVEAVDMKPADLNGLADPYVKGQLGPYKFRTKTQKKTLAPKWQEEFKIPIHTWESPNVLFIEVRDQDRFIDDTLGDCSVKINNLRGGQRHDKWLPLQNIKMGRLHLAVTVLEDDGKEGEHPSDKEQPNEKENGNARASEADQHDSTQQAPKMADEFEPINIEGQQRTGIWVHHPGSTVSQTWEPRKREGKRPDIEILRVDNDSMNSSGSIAADHCNSSSESENPVGNRSSGLNTIRMSLKKIGSVFQRSPRNESSANEGEAVTSPHINVHAISEKEIGVRFELDDENSGDVRDQKQDKNSLSPEKGQAGSPRKGHMGGMKKSILRQASRSVKHALGRIDSRKSKEVPEPLIVTEREVSLRSSDSSDKESLLSSKEYSSIIEGIPIESTSVVGVGEESPSPSAKEENVVGEASFQGPDEMAANVAGHGGSLAKIVSFRDTDRMDDDAEGHRKPPDRKLSKQGSGRTDDAVADHTYEHGQELPQSSFPKVSEGTSEGK